jgi:hypothetical protein
MKKIFLYWFLFLNLLCLAQGEANIWYFGQLAGLDFNSGNPVALTDGQMQTNEGCATISNSGGQLLFYTDGKTIWDKNHNIMPNGTGLLGHSSSTQSAIIIPKPGSSTIYYVFTVIDLGNPAGVCYSEVDISLNGGFGMVTTKNVQLLTPACEKLTAIKKSNSPARTSGVTHISPSWCERVRVASASVPLVPSIKITKETTTTKL